MILMKAMKKHKARSIAKRRGLETSASGGNLESSKLIRKSETV